MSVIIWIIVILIVVSLLAEFLGDLVENIGMLFGGVFIVIVAIVLFRLFGRFLKWLLKWLHFLICLIPQSILYLYVFLFLAIVTIWFIICILNVAIQYAVEDVLFTYRYIGTLEDLKREVRAELLRSHSGIMAFVLNSKRCERILLWELRDNSYGLKERCCTFVVFEEFASVLDSLGMATDKEILQMIQSGQDYSLEVVEITKNMEDFYCGLSRLVNNKRAELVLLNQDDEGVEGDYYEPKLYKSKNPLPSPENMLPTQVIDWDDL